MSSRADDSALLNPPMPTGIEGVGALMKFMKDGTAEVKKLLLDECDTLLECRYCRNIFRSTINFISHKRSFCRISHVQVVHANLSAQEQAGMSTDQSKLTTATKKKTNIINVLNKRSGIDTLPIIDSKEVLNLHTLPRICKEIPMTTFVDGKQEIVGSLPANLARKEEMPKERTMITMPQDNSSRYREMQLRNRREQNAGRVDSRPLSISEMSIVERYDRFLPDTADYVSLQCLVPDCSHIRPFASIPALAYHATVRHVVEKSRKEEKEREDKDALVQIPCILCGRYMRSREGVREHLIRLHINVKRDHLKGRDDESTDDKKKKKMNPLVKKNRFRSLSPSSLSSSDGTEPVGDSDDDKPLAKSSTGERKKRSRSALRGKRSSKKEGEEGEEDEEMKMEGTPSSATSSQSRVSSMRSDDLDTDGEAPPMLFAQTTITPEDEISDEQAVARCVAELTRVVSGEEEAPVLYEEKKIVAVSEEKRKRGRPKKRSLSVVGGTEAAIANSTPATSRLAPRNSHSTDGNSRRSKESTVPRGKKKRSLAAAGSADPTLSAPTRSSARKRKTETPEEEDGEEEEKKESSEEQAAARPSRARRRPGWMTNEDFVVKKAKTLEPIEIEDIKQEEPDEITLTDEFVLPPDTERLERSPKKKFASESRIPSTPKKTQEDCGGRDEMAKFLYTPKAGKYIAGLRKQNGGKDRDDERSREGSADDSIGGGSRRRKQNLDNVADDDDFQIVQMGDGRQIQRRSDLASVPVYLSEQQQKLFFSGLKVMEPTNEKEKEYYECEYCKARMPNVRDGRRHMVAHLRVMRLRCALCSAGAFFCIDMRNHLQMRGCPNLSHAAKGIVSPGHITPCMSKQQADSLTYIAHPVSPGRTLFTSGKIVSILSNKPYLPDPVIEEAILGPSRVPPHPHLSPKKPALKLIKTALNFKDSSPKTPTMRPTQSAMEQGTMEASSKELTEEEAPVYYEDAEESVAEVSKEVSETSHPETPREKSAEASSIPSATSSNGV